MVEKKDLHVIKTGLLHCRTEMLDKLLLILPRHHKRHRVSRIKRLILHCNGMNIKTFLLHYLDPLHEILSIVIIA